MQATSIITLTRDQGRINYQFERGQVHFNNGKVLEILDSICDIYIFNKAELQSSFGKN